MPPSRAVAAAIVTLLGLVVAGCSDDRRAMVLPPVAATASGLTTGSGSTAPIRSATTRSTPAPVQSSTPIARVPVAHLGTRWPIVLVHGAGGSRILLGAEYFLGVAGHLRSLGYEVLITNTPPGGVEDHARELRVQIAAAYPDPAVKLNLIAHSMGGLDSRAMIVRQGMGGRIATLTTISTPHRGSPAADAILTYTPSNVQPWITPIMNMFGFDWTQLQQLGTAFVLNTFNPVTPDDPRVHYQSYAGLSDPSGATGTRMQAVLWATWAFVANAEGPNDGMVSLTSARWGTWRGTIPADHASEIGHFPRFHTFDQVKFYERVAADLVVQGF